MRRSWIDCSDCSWSDAAAASSSSATFMVSVFSVVSKLQAAAVLAGSTPPPLQLLPLSWVEEAVSVFELDLFLVAVDLPMVEEEDEEDEGEADALCSLASS